MKFSQTRTGELIILAEAFIWAFFPIVTILSLHALPPLSALAYSSIILVAFFSLVIVIKGKTKEIFIPQVWKYLPLVVLCITVIYYGCYFAGLKYTSAGNASIIALLELLFSYLLFNVWKKDDFPARHAAGAVLMLLGGMIILFPQDGWHFQVGDWLIVLAVAAAPLGNYYQQKLRRLVSSETILFLRSLLAIPVFFILGYLLKINMSPLAAWPVMKFLLLNGLIILGLSKLLWIEGIHRISVTKAAALGGISPLFTLIFANIILGEHPRLLQWLSLIPIIFGVWLLTQKPPASQPQNEPI